MTVMTGDAVVCVGVVDMKYFQESRTTYRNSNNNNNNNNNNNSNNTSQQRTLYSTRRVSEQTL